jgi:hypothetical protein
VVFGKIDMRALRERVDARIRSSGTMNARWFAKHPLKRALHMILDRIAMRLTLPAGEWRAVVRDDEL